jgi:hypothetical protein
MYIATIHVRLCCASSLSDSWLIRCDVGQVTIIEVLHDDVLLEIFGLCVVEDQISVALDDDCLASLTSHYDDDTFDLPWMTSFLYLSTAIVYIKSTSFALFLQLFKLKRFGQRFKCHSQS